jgi:hypothetical protein
MNSENYINFLKFYELYKKSSETLYDGRKIILTCKDKAREQKALSNIFTVEDLGESEQFSMELYTDKIRIFRNKHTFFKDFYEKETTIDFAIICPDDSFLFFSYADNKTFALNSNGQIVESESRLVTNAIYFKKILKLVEDRLAIYNDDTKNELIIVSTSGKKAFPIGYPRVQEELAEYNLEAIFYQLEKEIDRKDFIPFFNNEICKTLSGKGVEERYIEFLKQHSSIIKSATLDFEIYLKDFSFDKIKTKFRENRDIAALAWVKYFIPIQQIFRR